VKKSLSLGIVPFLILFLIFSPGVQADEEEIFREYLWTEVSHLKPPKRPRIGLVLGGGGARGLAHIGVLRILENENIPIDIISGVSVGALVGGLYAAGVEVEKLENIAQNIGWEKITNISTEALVRLLVAEKLLSTEKLEKYISQEVENKRFDELKIPFACVATDLKTGEKIIFREGLLAPAVRASATIPGVFEPVEYRQRYLVDGGLVDNLPVEVAKMLGADIIIAVAVSADFTQYSTANILLTLNQAIYIQSEVLTQEQLNKADLLVLPKVKDITAVEIWRAEECISAGIIAARKALPEIKKLIMQETFTRLFPQ
jgi:NTE family protein